MTTRTRGPVRAKRARIAAEPVQDQLNLGVPSLSENGMDSQMDIHDNSSLADAAIGRAFVPSNRELLLRQLSALVLSPDFPRAAGTPMGLSQRVMVINDGLRVGEIDILADGRPQRFPVLAEIRSSAVQSGAGAFGIRDVVALHFRNEDEATNFRFRPVDELDTAYIPCLTAPSMFGLGGDARFSSRETVPPAQDGRNAAVADRIAGAVCCLLQLSQAEPGCREAIADLLSRRSSEPWLMALAHHAMPVPGSDSAGACAAIIRGFIEHDEGSPKHLVQELGQYLGELADPDVTRAVPRWLQMADAVIGNRIVLDGDVLSDNGSIALRAAILAVIVDDVKDLVAFIHAERPAGMQVVVGAAFLIGMRTGVADLPWQGKLPHLDLLSPLLVALHQSEPAARQEALGAFQAEPDESAFPLQLVLYWRDMQILRWVPRSEPDSVGSASDAVYVNTDAEVPSCQESSLDEYDHGRDRTITGPEGRVIEILAPSDSTEMTSFRLLLKETDRLRKAKEIMEASCTRAVCWRVGVTGEGVEALYLDIAGRPSDAFLEIMNLKLAEALSLYLVPAKPKRRAKATTASKREAVTPDS